MFYSAQDKKKKKKKKGTHSRRIYNYKIIKTRKAHILIARHFAHK